MSDKIAVVYIGDKAEQEEHRHRHPPGFPPPYPVVSGNHIAMQLGSPPSGSAKRHPAHASWRGRPLPRWRPGTGARLAAEQAAWRKSRTWWSVRRDLAKMTCPTGHLVEGEDLDIEPPGPKKGARYRVRVRDALKAKLKAEQR